MANEFKLSFTASEINTRLGEIDNVVKFTEQNLTEYQKAQIRENIGIKHIDYLISYDDVAYIPYSDEIVDTFIQWGNTQVIKNEDNTLLITRASQGNGGIISNNYTPNPNLPVHVEFTLDSTHPTSWAAWNIYLQHGSTLKSITGTKIMGTFAYEFIPSEHGFNEYFQIILARKMQAGETITLSNLKVYQNTLEEFSIFSNSLAEVIEKTGKEINFVNKKIDKLETRVSPNGEKYVLQIINDGTVIGTPIVPSKALFIGNSLLTGFGFGMAASDSQHDYYHLINQAIVSQKSNYTSTKMSGTSWEACTTEDAQTSFLDNTLLQNLSEELELVIVQLGDNVDTDAKLAVFEQGSRSMLQFIRTKCPKARVAWVGEWYSSTAKQAYIKAACEKTGSIFIDISDLNIVANQSAVGNTYTDSNGTVQTITDTGVASHPGDAGFRAIANRILYELEIVDTEAYYT